MRGWKRIYTESANREVRRLKRYAARTPMLCVVLPMSCVLLILMSVKFGEASSVWVGVVAGGAGLLVWALGVGSMYRLSRAPLLYLPLSMVGAVLTGRIFRAAADDLVEGTPTVWGGKSYVRKAEDS